MKAAAEQSCRPTREMYSVGMTRIMLAAALLAVSPFAPVAMAQVAKPASNAATPLDKATRRAIVDGAIARLTEHYVYPEKVPAITRALRTHLATGEFDAIGDPKAFAKAVTAAMQAVANDRHLALFWSADPLPPLGDAAVADVAETGRQALRMARENYAIPKAEVLDGNIGLLRMDGFVPAQTGGATLAAAMEFLRHTDALIVDLRANGGGEPDMVQLAVSYFVPPQTLINTFHQRGKAVRDQFWSLPYVPGGRWSLDKPVLVLVGKGTASAAEEFAYDIQQLKRGTIVGEPTWGGANPGEVSALDTHFAIFVPSGSAINPISQSNWEGSGIKPDVPVPADTALAAARRIALEKLIAGADADRRSELEKLLSPPPP